MLGDASVATPLALVVALPTLVPFRVKLIVLPLTPLPPAVNVAESAAAVLPP
jgi:hypothetical protein